MCSQADDPTQHVTPTKPLIHEVYPTRHEPVDGLRAYVEHRPNCACRGRNAMGPACDCGLAEALAAAPAEERGGVDVDRLAYAVRLSRASTRHWNTLRDDEQAEAIARVYQSSR